MYYYLCSRQPSAVKINGVYFGLIDKNPKLIPCNSTDRYVEVCPINNSSESATGFLLNEKFLSSPPINFNVIDLDGGYVIYLTQRPNNKPFKVVSQHKLPFALVTVFSQGTNNITIETPNDFFTTTLEFEFEEVNYHLLQKELLLIEFIGSKKWIIAYDLRSKITLKFCRQVDELSLENQEFSTTERISDIAGHEITYTWHFKENSFIIVDKKICKSKEFNRKGLHEKVLPFAFLEEFMVGGDSLEFLADNIIENFKKLPNYLGKFIGIFPAPFFRKDDEVALLYKKTENVFFTKYFSFTIYNNKISNIKCNS